MEEALRELVAVAQACRYCEGLQNWWGTDSDDMHALDDALAHGKEELRARGWTIDTWGRSTRL